MLSAAIQSTVAGVVTNTSFAIEDEEITVPFCVHRELQRPEREKKGITGYVYDVEIGIIDNTPEDVETKKGQIRAAIEALEDTTTEGTGIEIVEYIGDNPAFDEESRLYTTIMSFVITTNNI